MFPLLAMFKVEPKGVVEQKYQTRCRGGGVLLEADFFLTMLKMMLMGIVGC